MYNITQIYVNVHYKTFHYYPYIFDHFEQLTRDDLMKIISVMNKTTCVSDPFPTKLLMSHLPAIVDIILGIVNLCFESAVFPLSCKSSVIIPLIKKPGLDSEVLKNYLQWRSEGNWRPEGKVKFCAPPLKNIL